MEIHRSALRSVAAGVLAITAAAWLTGAAAQPKEGAVRTSSEGGITIVVTPKASSPDREWAFTVALDTHSQDLGDDLVASSVLLVNGAQAKPTAWTGAAPGGHHREGVLTFAPVEKPTGAVELRIQRPGEVQPRTFRWDGADVH
jgi:hypothetical protein